MRYQFVCLENGLPSLVTPHYRLAIALPLTLNHAAENWCRRRQSKRPKSLSADRCEQTVDIMQAAGNDAFLANLQQTWSDVQGKMQELESLKKRLASTKEQLAGATDNARVAQSRIRELEDFTGDQRAHISRLQKSLVAEKESCTGAQAALERAQKEAACHKASLAGIREFCDALQRDIAAKEDERAAAQSAAQSAVERGREQLHKLTADATAEQQRLREQVDTAKAAAAAQEKEAAEARRQLQLVTATLGDAQQRADALGAECVSLKAQQKAGDEAQRQLQADLDRRIGLGDRLASDLSILRERAQAARLDEKERRASLEEDVGRLQGLVERHAAAAAAAEALAGEVREEAEINQRAQEDFVAQLRQEVHALKTDREAETRRLLREHAAQREELEAQHVATVRDKEASESLAHVRELDLEAARAELSSVRKELDQSERRAEASDAKVSSLITERASLEERISVAEKNACELCDRDKASRLEIRALEDGISALNQEVQHARDELGSCQRESVERAAHFQAEEARLEETVRELRGKREELYNNFCVARSEAEGCAAAATRRIEDMAVQVAQLRDGLATSERRCQQVAADHEVDAKKHARFRAEADAVNAELRADLDAAKEEIRGLQGELHARVQGHTDLQAQLREAEEKRLREQHEHQRAKHQLNDELSKQLRSAQDDTAAERVAVRSLQAELDHLRGELAAVQEEAASQILAFSERSRVLVAEADVLRDERRNAQNELKKRTRKVEAAVSTISDLRAELDALKVNERDRIARLQGELARERAGRKDDARRYAAEVKGATDELASCQEAEKKARGEMNSKLWEAESAHREIAATRSELEEAKENIEELRRENRSLKKNETNLTGFLKSVVGEKRIELLGGHGPVPASSSSKHDKSRQTEVAVNRQLPVANVTAPSPVGERTAQRSAVASKALQKSANFLKKKGRSPDAADQVIRTTSDFLRYKRWLVQNGDNS